jgi:hypothetical protein
MDVKLKKVSSQSSLKAKPDMYSPTVPRILDYFAPSLLCGLPSQAGTTALVDTRALGPRALVAPGSLLGSDRVQH